MKGLIKGGKGNSHTIATLPEGWRPKGIRMFCQDQSDKCARVDVHPDGRIHLVVGYQSGWLPLDGMQFVIA